ncbi:hypothetical protein L6452_08909 [Arctium lappa]|uniref:Uncharacterized protein n=1 Tax=Arctium lappa TaxID=4217 RepID=A0ACB9DIW0_ARCLA|nr:hypothetical protein L6452_08909 [Arctium lappa]
MWGGSMVGDEFRLGTGQGVHQRSWEDRGERAKRIRHDCTLSANHDNDDHKDEGWSDEHQEEYENKRKELMKAKREVEMMKMENECKTFHFVVLAAFVVEGQVKDKSRCFSSLRAIDHIINSVANSNYMSAD